MKKRGSLSLSINAIVILVLAITMLGLGLGFTKGMFSKFQSKLEVPEPDIPATADDQIALPGDTIKVIKGKAAVFSVNVYNDQWTGEISPSLSCVGDNAPVAQEGVSQSIAMGKDAMFKFVLPKSSTNTRGTYICKLSFTGEGGSDLSKQIVIEIQ
ncbi:hypothetical protein HOK51_05745 [Candidatus Woesearchaeota archaeon]|jgi:hypothetical protein|nr:hypothetical protein [Candidatus Woesearchaeota archaeon]MBT6519332.1 hypothetical protein [Candidatus Woesearchaeota archaeon]MBT7366792.1 hypothetical protein [Candidatus Woesearchaeota archaeon]